MVSVLDMERPLLILCVTWCCPYFVFVPKEKQRSDRMLFLYDPIHRCAFLSNIMVSAPLSNDELPQTLEVVGKSGLYLLEAKSNLISKTVVRLRVRTGFGVREGGGFCF